MVRPIFPWTYVFDNLRTGFILGLFFPTVCGFQLDTIRQASTGCFSASLSRLLDLLGNPRNDEVQVRILLHAYLSTGSVDYVVGFLSCSSSTHRVGV
jgi:hypothetical protein